jgi:hypothetical protein
MGGHADAPGCSGMREAGRTGGGSGLHPRPHPYPGFPTPVPSIPPGRRAARRAARAADGAGRAARLCARARAARHAAAPHARGQHTGEAKPLAAVTPELGGLAGASVPDYAGAGAGFRRRPAAAHANTAPNPPRPVGPCSHVCPPCRVSLPRASQLVAACTSAHAYARNMAADLTATQGGASAALRPGLAVVKQVLLIGVFWAIQILVFPFRICWAAPVQLAAAAAHAAAFRSFACAVAGDAALAAAALRLCGWAEAVTDTVLCPTMPILRDSSKTCGAGAVEFLVTLVHTFSSLLPVRGGTLARVPADHGMRQRGRAPRRHPPPCGGARQRASALGRHVIARAALGRCGLSRPEHSPPPPQPLLPTPSCTWSTPRRSASRWATSRRRAACRRITARAVRLALPARATPSQLWAAC